MANDLTDLNINEVAFCRRGMNKNARVALFKSEDNMPSPIMAKIAKLFATAFPTPELAKQQIADLAKEDDARTFDQVVGMAEVWQAIWQATDALNTSIRSILDSEEPAKEPLLNQSLDEFKQHLLDVVSAAAKAPVMPESEQEASAPMSEDLKKSLGLAATATDAEVAAAVTKMAADLAKARADAAFAAMPEAHRDYAVTKALAGDDLAAFVAKSADERDAVIKAEPVAKSAADIELAKRDRENAELRKSVEDLRKKSEVADIAKRAEVEMVNIGKADDVATLLYDITKLDAKLGEAVETMLKTANERIAKGDLFTEHGSGARGVAKAASAIEAKADDLRKANPTWSIQKARSEARKQNPDLATAEREESRQAA